MKNFCLFVMLTAFAQTSFAEVTASAPEGFVSEHQLVLAATPERAYAALVDDIALWWDASHSYSGQAAAFTLNATAGGCFCEQTEDISVAHMRVGNAQTGRSLTLLGGLGPLQSMAVTGSMTFSFEPHAQGSLLKYSYRVGGYVPGGLEAMAGPVDQVQLGQLKRLQKYLASGEPLNQ